MKYDCLIIDDERLLSENTKEYLEFFNLKVDWRSGFNTALDFFNHHTTGLILLDINLGDESGFTLCKKIREITKVPIIFISARESDDDIVWGLSVGGDDYIKKPYSLNVLLAKVNATLKRYKDANTAPDTVTDFIKRIKPGERIDLTAIEYKLLSYLMKQPGQIISKEELFEKVWDDNFVEDNTLNVHVRRLREKIETNPSQPQYVKTVRGLGYIFDEKAAKPLSTSQSGCTSLEQDKA